MTTPAPTGRPVSRRTLLASAATGAASLVVGAGAGVVAGRENASLANFGGVGQERDRAGLAVPPGGDTRLGRSEVIWSVETDQPKVALTFDDGPDPEFTPRILAALAAAGVHATFNVMGYNVAHHADLLRELVRQGHEVGNHTWGHENLVGQTAEQTDRQLRRGKDAVEQVTQTPLRFFRPPRGVLTGSAMRCVAELGHDVLLWSVTGSGAAEARTPREVADYLVKTVRAGDVLALHDGIGRGTFRRGGANARHLRARRELEVQALPAVLAGARANGVQFVTAAELVGEAASFPAQHP